MAELARALAPSLTSFTKAAKAEGLAGYVIGAPQSAGTERLAEWRASLERELSMLDPAGADEPRHAGDLLFNGVGLSAVMVALDGPPGVDGVRSLLVLEPGEWSMPPGEMLIAPRG